MEFVRGDTYGFKVYRKDSNGDIITDKVDEMYFTVKNAYADKNYKFQKTLSSGDIVFDEEDFSYYITIEPSDTDDLKFKKYVYDIETITDGVKKTTTGTMKLLPEVTHAENEV